MNYLGDRRAGGTEWMDDPAIETQRFVDSLRGLRRINKVTRSHAALWPIVRETALANPEETLRVLDVGCGGGDHIIALAKRANRAGIDVAFAGCDLSPLAVEHAAAETKRAGIPVEFFILDAVRDPIPRDYDLIVSSFFLHHLDDEQAAAFLQKTATATQHSIAAYDLLRSRPGYALAWFGTRALACNDVCRNDGPLSVANAFSLDEARGIANRAGLEDGVLETRFPFRFLFRWTRPGAASP